MTKKAAQKKKVVKKTAIETPPVVKGYKVFNPDFSCNPGGNKIIYQENKEFTYAGEIKICNRGLHFCLKAQDCFKYYDFNSDNIVCEVEARGKVQYHDEDSKACTDILYIGRRLSWNEVLEVANSGKNNTGHSNTGSSNTGSRNTGYRNTGDWNTGSSNTGDWNTGYSNTGDSNTGDSNTGDWNTGSRNTGYSNTGDSNTGIFCIGKENPKIEMFNKPSDWTITDFQNSRAFSLLRNNVDTKIWVNESIMTDDEKKLHHGYQKYGGCYRDIPFKDAFQNAWNNWDSRNRESFTLLPNFDKTIFEEITGVKL